MGAPHGGLLLGRQSDRWRHSVSREAVAIRQKLRPCSPRSRKVPSEHGCRAGRVFPIAQTPSLVGCESIARSTPCWPAGLVLPRVVVLELFVVASVGGARSAPERRPQELNRSFGDDANSRCTTRSESLER